MKVVRTLVFSLLCFLPVIALAQDGAEISVADIQLPNLRWGTQQANFEVTNKTEYLKFIAVVTTISFTESYFKPVRKARTNYILGPLESKILTPKIYVPGNYGPATILVQLFDVIDTVDVLLPRQKIFEQPIIVQYHVPDPILSYVTERITLPPIVDHSGNWDNDMSRILLLLMREKKTIPEIAKMASADEAFVRDVAEQLVVVTAFKKTNDTYEPNFAVILNSEAEKFRPLAEQFSDSLATLIQNNLTTFRKVRDSLIKSGAMTADTSDFLNPGGVLLHEYPIIGGLLLWNLLGKEFITEKKSFTIFDGTDYCNAYTPFYMYAVQGGADVNGRQFYSAFLKETTQDIDFSDFIPHIECEADYRAKFRDRRSVTWDFGKDEGPEGFVYTATVVDPAIETLAVGSEPMLAWAQGEFAKTVQTCAFQNFAFGPKYWFWNWVSTMTLDKLIKNKAVTRRGNGHYHFQSM